MGFVLFLWAVKWPIPVKGLRGVPQYMYRINHVTAINMHLYILRGCGLPEVQPRNKPYPRRIFGRISSAVTWSI